MQISTSCAGVTFANRTPFFCVIPSSSGNTKRHDVAAPGGTNNGKFIVSPSKNVRMVLTSAFRKLYMSVSFANFIKLKSVS